MEFTGIQAAKVRLTGFGAVNIRHSSARRLNGFDRPSPSHH